MNAGLEASVGRQRLQPSRVACRDAALICERLRKALPLRLDPVTPERLRTLCILVQKCLGHGPIPVVKSSPRDEYPVANCHRRMSDRTDECSTVVRGTVKPDDLQCNSARLDDGIIDLAFQACLAMMMDRPVFCRLRHFDQCHFIWILHQSHSVPLAIAD